MPVPSLSNARGNLPGLPLRPDGGARCVRDGEREEVPRATAEGGAAGARYADDHDVETTACLLGISPGTVKGQASRGLAALRERLTAAHAIATGEETS